MVIVHFYHHASDPNLLFKPFLFLFLELCYDWPPSRPHALVKCTFFLSVVLVAELNWIEPKIIQKKNNHQRKQKKILVKNQRVCILWPSLDCYTILYDFFYRCVSNTHSPRFNYWRDYGDTVMVTIVCTVITIIMIAIAQSFFFCRIIFIMVIVHFFTQFNRWCPTNAL